MKLVVVGDQSSSKSSVLEGLTDLSSPRDNGARHTFRHADRLPSSREVEYHNLDYPVACGGFKNERETSGFQDPPYDFTLRRRVLTSPFQGPEGHRTQQKKIFDTCE